MKQIWIKINNLRQRATPSLSGAAKGFASQGIHDFDDTIHQDGYKWYQIENHYWVAAVQDAVVEIETTVPQPVAKDTTKNQVFIDAALTGLRIRIDPNTNATILGNCVANSYYDVFKSEKGAYYTWYKLAEKAWIAAVDGVNYIPSKGI